MTDRVPPELYRVRPMRESDHALVFKTWLTSWMGGPLPRMLASEKWALYAGHHRIVERILARASGLVACAQEDEETAFAWVVFEPATLHYVFVKGPFRGYGLSRALLRAALGEQCETSRITYSHKSPDLLRLTAARDPSAPPAKLTIPDRWVHCFYAVDGPVARYSDRREHEPTGAA